jgi:predicted GIY-YIG superfamily endonuclease
MPTTLPSRPQSSGRERYWDHIRKTSEVLYDALRGQNFIYRDPADAPPPFTSDLPLGRVTLKPSWARCATQTRWHLIRAAAVVWHDNRVRLGVRTACGDVLLSTPLHPGIPDDHFCDACLQGRVQAYAVYRAFGAADALLYVGFTGNLLSRLGQHRSSSAWFPMAVRWTYELFDDELDALNAESAAIAAENPIHNVWRPRQAA